MSEHGVPAGADGVSGACEPGARAAEAVQAAHPAVIASSVDGARGADGVCGADRTTLVAGAGRFEPAPAADAGTDPGRHLTREALWRFMDGGLSAEEMRHTFRHLLRGCLSCRQQAREVWNLTMPGAAAPAPAAARTPLVPPLIQESPPMSPIDSHHEAVEAVTAPATAAAKATVQPTAMRASAPDHRNLAALELVPASDCSDSSDSDGAQGGRDGHDGHDDPEATGANDAAYDAVLDRVFSRVAIEEAGLDAARRRSGALFEELMQHPAARQQLLVQNSSRFRDRMLCERLLQASHEEGFHDPARSQQLARVAVAVAERLATVTTFSVTSPDLLAGLRARAWAQLGNALRICSDHEASAAAFRTAEELLSANPRLGLLDKARVFDLRASLHRDRRQFAEAARLLDRVIAIYRRLGQSTLMGQALAQKGNVLLHTHDTAGSMTLLRRALELIDPQEDPRWYLIVRHNLIAALLDDGKPREAFAMLFHTRPLYLKMGDRMNLLRLRWLEGQVAQGLHRLEQAEAAFREVRDAFVDLGIEYDAALVSLDLAAVYVEQGRTAETRVLAQEMLAFFESRQIHREAMAAFLVFCNAAQMEQAGISLVREVAVFLKQARHTPDLRFSPPG
jgi:tetratricopeptide (TPR) repeat protein